jgi:oxygen-dependent protoporphyrinogen oxidase
VTDTPLRDCVVVGGGIAGLAAAWHLRERDVVLCEREPRVGGRVRSEQRGRYWLSVGAHLIPGPDSTVGRIVEELGLRTVPIPGSLFGIWMEGRLISGGRLETYPFRLPLERGARADLVRVGVRIRRAVAQYERLAHAPASPAELRARRLAFRNDRTFAAAVGRMHPQVDAIFRATAHRQTAEPEQIADGCMAASFAHVWSATGLARNMLGGAGRLPEEIARTLGPRVVITDAAVRAVVREPDGTVLVEYSSDGVTTSVRARSAILATPAYVTGEILVDPPVELARALSQIEYGPFVVAAILTSESSAMPWDDLYAVLTPGMSFDLCFNHANVLRTAGGQREPGGALMVYAGAQHGRELLGSSDAAIRELFLRDLATVFPQTAGIVEDVWIQRWEKALPLQPPGRGALQRILESGVSENVFLAGDYLGHFSQLESAAQTGREAAIRVRAMLGAGAGT